MATYDENTARIADLLTALETGEASLVDVFRDQDGQLCAVIECHDVETMLSIVEL